MADAHQPLYRMKAEFFKTLGHPARIRVLELLSTREHTVSEMLPEVIQELVCAPRPVFKLGLTVVPRDAHRLPLDVGAGNVGCDPPQETLDRAHPAQVKLE